MKFSIKNFFGKSLTENFIFCAVRKMFAVSPNKWRKKKQSANLKCKVLYFLWQQQNHVNYDKMKAASLRPWNQKNVSSWAIESKENCQQNPIWYSQIWSPFSDTRFFDEVFEEKFRYFKNYPEN